MTPRWRASTTHIPFLEIFQKDPKVCAAAMTLQRIVAWILDFIGRDRHRKRYAYSLEMTLSASHFVRFAGPQL